MYRMRDTCRSLFGPTEWKIKVSEWQPIVEAAMNKHHVSAIEAGMILTQQLDESNSASVNDHLWSDYRND